MRLREIHLSPRDVERFWGKVDKAGPTECWPWNGTRDRHGYGSFPVGMDKHFVASRVAWTVANDRQAIGLVCHTCDNPPCCNPAHLWVGTPNENTQDMMRKGRSGHASKTHCKWGHEFTAENTRSYRGHRFCRQCRGRYKQNERLRKLERAQ